MTATVVFMVFVAGVAAGAMAALMLTGHRWTVPEKEADESLAG